jgi:hypothetical protein
MNVQWCWWSTIWLVLITPIDYCSASSKFAWAPEQPELWVFLSGFGLGLLCMSCTSLIWQSLVLLGRQFTRTWEWEEAFQSISAEDATNRTKYASKLRNKYAHYLLRVIPTKSFYLTYILTFYLAFWHIFWHFFWQNFLAGKRRRGQLWGNLETFGL